MEYTIENYKKGIAEIEKEMEARKNKLTREYALALNPYKIGDIISDHTITLQIEKIEVYKTWGHEIPSCVYYGIELKKDSTPMKRQSNERIWQGNIITK